MDRATLISSIYSAFAQAGRPTPEEITNCRCWECAEIQREFGARPSRAVPAQVIHYQACAFALLSAKGFRYYLPRIIEVALDNEDESSGTVAEFLLYQFRQDRAERLKDLTSAERKALVDYLKFRMAEGRFWNEATEIGQAIQVICNA